MTAACNDLIQRIMEAESTGASEEVHRLWALVRETTPDDYLSQLELAQIEAKRGMMDYATARLERLAGLSPENFEPHFWLSVFYRSQNRLELSLNSALRAVELRPGISQLASNLGLAYMELQRLSEAVECFDRAIKLGRPDPRNFEMLGKALWLQGKESQALAAYKKAGPLGNRSIEATLVLAQISASQNRNEDAIDLASLVLAKEPGSTVARLVLAAARLDSGRADLARQEIDSVLQKDPNNSTAFVLAGMLQQAMGSLEEAKDSYRRSIEIQPTQGLAYCSLVRSGKMSEDQRPLLEKMENLVSSDLINPRGRSFLHFGLGKGLEDLGEYEAAMRHFDAANEIAYRLKFGDAKFDRSRLSDFVDWTISTFSEDLLKRFEAKSQDEAPIFIVGMMRSGTTLTEQILSAHPDVEGAGERAFWLTHFRRAIGPGSSSVDKLQLERLKSEYLQELRSLFPQADRITDKMPGNYRVLGLLAAAFPKAKFVHVKRNAVDTCLSIYMTPNRVANEFANHRENIVFAYRQYLRLIDHWKPVIGPDRLLTLEYEALVANPEPNTRRLLQHCDLPWDEHCLHPENNERSVITPSVWQVRQPVFTHSVARWHKYEPWLGAFSELTDL